jgi:EAL domain-containing protein (putative c-di-GMP-specific phosphodiesterase class I)
MPKISPMHLVTNNVFAITRSHKRVLAVRSYVLIKPRPGKVFPDRFVWAFSHQGLSKDLGAFFFRSAFRLFFSGSEALLTICPYEVDGKNYFFGRSLIRMQERTVRE